MSFPALASEVGFDNALYEEFTATRGTTFRRSVKLYVDESKTLPLDFEGLTFRLVIDGYMTLTLGEGLALTGESSDLIVTLTPTQTEEAPDNQHHYFVEVEEDPENTTAAIHGVITFENP